MIVYLWEAKVNSWSLRNLPSANANVIGAIALGPSSGDIIGCPSDQNADGKKTPRLGVFARPTRRTLMVQEEKAKTAGATGAAGHTQKVKMDAEPQEAVWLSPIGSISLIDKVLASKKWDVFIDTSSVVTTAEELNDLAEQFLKMGAHHGPDKTTHLLVGFLHAATKGTIAGSISFLLYTQYAEEEALACICRAAKEAKEKTMPSFDSHWSRLHGRGGWKTIAGPGLGGGGVVFTLTKAAGQIQSLTAMVTICALAMLTGLRWSVCFNNWCQARPRPEERSAPSRAKASWLWCAHLLSALADSQILSLQRLLTLVPWSQRGLWLPVLTRWMCQSPDLPPLPAPPNPIPPAQQAQPKQKTWALTAKGPSERPLVEGRKSKDLAAEDKDVAAAKPHISMATLAFDPHEAICLEEIDLADLDGLLGAVSDKDDSDEGEEMGLSSTWSGNEDQGGDDKDGCVWSRRRGEEEEIGNAGDEPEGQGASHELRGTSQESGSATDSPMYDAAEPEDQEER
ncbi:hypothetical protein BDK51DRAFT_34817 [Blyttiomyces helicus]|uniref:Uncharacterized protein n=1 Tax=Blyttiomyces helicus TaxID=388810 RepID=A0A4P9WM03_9FUNG|nr:hypothetical protein BDK51DRAFT_34817 [Blyttiomyces helicus]|eukprot:RKO92678.1 hypothetical protein BDK51DRAFT_34817 [Blyttiomyces helicus]